MLRIGLSMNYNQHPGQRERAYLDEPYLSFLSDFDIVPMLIPPTEDKVLLDEYLDRVNGVVLTGGLDVDPSLWDEPCHPKTRLLHPRRQAGELALYARAVERRLPILGICLGIQLINVAHGGSIHQYLPDCQEMWGHRPSDDQATSDSGKDAAAESEGCYEGQAEYTGTHTIILSPESRLYQWVCQADIPCSGRDDRDRIAQAEDPDHRQVVINSLHQQGLHRLGAGLTVAARAEDGLVEAIERHDLPFCLAVQWHPEIDMANPINRLIGREFTTAAESFRQHRQ